MLEARFHHFKYECMDYSCVFEIRMKNKIYKLLLCFKKLRFILLVYSGLPFSGNTSSVGELVGGSLVS